MNEWKALPRQGEWAGLWRVVEQDDVKDTLMVIADCDTKAIARRIAKLPELEAIDAKLPKTADGATVVPFVDPVWAVATCGVERRYWEHSDCSWVYGNLRHKTIRVSECYSTREAAEAAGKETDS